MACLDKLETHPTSPENAMTFLTIDFIGDKMGGKGTYANKHNQKDIQQVTRNSLIPEFG